MAEETCSNCKKSIPVESILLHQVHCERFLFKCENCGEILKKSEKLSHHSQFHQSVKCEYCNRDFEKSLLAVHVSSCAAKPRPCLYCSAHFDLYNLTNHEDSCGNRTDLCENCGKYIKLRIMDEHLAACLENENAEVLPEKRKPRSINPAKKRLKHFN